MRLQRTRAVGRSQESEALSHRIPSFVGHFSPGRAKNDLQKKESTMLPQANKL